MLDYVKFKILNPNTRNLLQSKILDFKGGYSESTGEIFGNKLIAEFHFCKVEVYKSGSVYFFGSIHKLYNSLNNIIAPNYNKSKPYKGFNGNQFTLDNIITVRTYLSKILHCEPTQMIFENIEIGLNLTTQFSPQKFLTGLLFHKGKQFEHSKNKSLWVAIKYDYRVKLYNKSKQYGMKNHTMRYELHFDRMARITEKGITTFADLDAFTLDEVHKLLIEEFLKVAYYDNTIFKKDLNKRQLNALIKYRDVRYWIEDLKPNKRDEPRKKLSEIIVNHSENLQAQILFLIEKTRVIITRHFELKNGVKKKQTRVINTYSSIGANITLESQRKCPVTGLDISMQKEAGNLASNTGFKTLEKNNPKEFKKWMQILLTGKENKFETNIYLKLSKQVRNRYYNNRSSYNPSQQRLF